MRGLDYVLAVVGCLAVLGGIVVADEVTSLPAPLLWQPQETAPVTIGAGSAGGCPAEFMPGEVPMDDAAFPARRPFAGWLGLTTRLPLDRKGVALGGSRPRGGVEGTDHSIWWGEAMGVPTFNWGYFGIPGRKYSVNHEAYYGDYREWGVRRGY